MKYASWRERHMWSTQMLIIPKYMGQTHRIKMFNLSVNLKIRIKISIGLISQTYNSQKLNHNSFWGALEGKPEAEGSVVSRNSSSDRGKAG